MFRFGLSVGGCAGFGLLIGACVGSEVTYTGAAKYPAKAVGCEVNVFPSTTPDYKWTDMASVEAHCHFTQGRTACVNELKKRVCELGGDTLYAFKDGRSGEAIIVIATVGHREEGSVSEAVSKSGGTPPPVKGEGEAASASAASSDAPAPPAGCDPPCSPGYKCSENQCLALCNPPCGEGMRCNQQRMCESTAPAPK